jgi:hypothetical protein
MMIDRAVRRVADESALCIETPNSALQFVSMSQTLT